MWQNYKVEWKSWWRGDSWFVRMLPLTAVVVQIALRAHLSEVSVEDIFFATMLFTTYYALPAKRAPFSFWLPLYCGWIAHLVFLHMPPEWFTHFTGKESSEIDHRFLTFMWQDKPVTVPEFLNLWVSPSVVGYLGNILVAVPLLVVAYSAVLRFYYSTKGTARYSAWGIDTLSPQMNWAIVCVWAGSHFGFPSLHVALLTITAFYAFKFGTHRAAVVVSLVGVAMIAMMAGRAHSVDVIFGIVEGLLFASVADMIAYQRPKRHAQKVWSPSLSKKDPAPLPRRKVS